MSTHAGHVIRADDVAVVEADQGDIAFSRRRLAAAAGAKRVGLSSYAVPAGRRQMPLHVHGDEEEIFHVTGGSGVVVVGKEAFAVGPGDTIVHRTDVDGGAPHTLLAGDEGLEVLAFATGSDTHLTWLPRCKVLWAGPRWVPADGPHPFAAEAAAGTLEAPEVAEERASNVLALRDAPTGEGDGATWRRLGKTAGAVRSALNHVTLDAGGHGSPLHCHALEEELFVVLDGDGVVLIGDERFAIAAGSIVARPPATGVAHQLQAGPRGLTYLAYATKHDGDAVLYPERRKVRLMGLGVTLDLPAQ